MGQGGISDASSVVAIFDAEAGATRGCRTAIAPLRHFAGRVFDFATFMFDEKYLSIQTKRIRNEVRQDVVDSKNLLPPPSNIRQWAVWPIRGFIHRQMKQEMRKNIDPTLSSAQAHWDAVDDPETYISGFGCDFHPATDENEKKYRTEYHRNVSLQLGRRHGGNAQVLKGFALTTDLNEKMEIKNAKTAEVNGNKPPNFNNGNPVVVFFGGWGRPVEAFSKASAEYYALQHNANFIALNYRGFGGSTKGIPSQRSMVEDGWAIVRHLLEQGVPPAKIVLHGYSMGGNIAANVLQVAEAEDLQLGALVLDRPMASIPSGAGALTARRHPSLLPKIVSAFAWMFLEPMKTQKCLQKLNGKTPIVGIYDTDPIGELSRMMLERNAIVCKEAYGGHGDHTEATLALNEVLLDKTVELFSKNPT